MRVQRLSGILLATPIGLLLVFGVLVPSLIMLLYSFYSSEGFTVTADLNLDSYREVFTDSTLRPFLVNTLAIAFPVMVLSVCGGLAIAYYAAFHAGRARTPLLALVVISMMGSYLVRMYAWRTLLGENGVINSGLSSLGVIDDPFGFLIFNRQAVIVAEVNFLMPFSALLFYAALAGISPDAKEAARDLGASRLQALRRVILPQVGPAILGAAAFTFFLACGDYITPVLLGGNDSTTWGTLISDQLRTTGNLPLGSAFAFTLVLLFLFVFLLLRTALRAGQLLPKVPRVEA